MDRGRAEIGTHADGLNPGIMYNGPLGTSHVRSINWCDNRSETIL